MLTSMYRTEVSRNAPRDALFHGVADAWQVADTVLGWQTSSAYRAARTERLIAAQELGMFIVGYPQTAVINVDFERFPPLVAAPREILVFDADIEWSTTTLDEANYKAILIPRQRLYPYIGDSTLVRPRTIGTSNTLHGMLEACFTEFAKLKDQSGPVAVGATQVLVHLIAVACGLHPGENGEVQQSIADARLLQIGQHITANLHNPSLNAATVARHLGISVRRLHALYEQTNSTIARHILSARLEHARELLIVRRDMTVLEIGFACGFFSQSTFYRRFADTFGMPPGEYRKALFGDG